jgi:urea transport system ATP-binding protein
MTPDLMHAGAKAREAHDAKAKQSSASGGRETSYSRIALPGVLDVAHGAILYLDDITVSFDGFRRSMR